MTNPAHQRFLNFHGQRGARLDRNATIYGTKGRRSLFGEVLSLGLFCAPDVHFRALQDIWVDKTVGHVPWNRLIGRLTSEWRDFTLYVRGTACDDDISGRVMIFLDREHSFSTQMSRS